MGGKSISGERTELVKNGESISSIFTTKHSKAKSKFNCQAQGPGQKIRQVKVTSRSGQGQGQGQAQVIFRSGLGPAQVKNRDLSIRRLFLFIV